VERNVGAERQPEQRFADDDNLVLVDLHRYGWGERLSPWCPQRALPSRQIQ
jgi:hypothetical protein